MPAGFLDCSNAYLPVDEESPPATKLFNPKSSKTYAVTVSGVAARPGPRSLRRKVVNCEFETSVQMPDFGSTMSSDPSFQSIGGVPGAYWNSSIGHSAGSGGGVLSNYHGSNERIRNNEDSTQLQPPHAHGSGHFSAGSSSLNSSSGYFLGQFSSRAPGHLYESSNTLLTSEHSGGAGTGIQMQIQKVQRGARHPAIILPNGSLSARATLSRSPLSRTTTPALSSRVGSPQKKSEFNTTSSSIQTAISEPLHRFVQSARKHVDALRPNVGMPFVLPFGRNQQNGPQAVQDDESFPPDSYDKDDPRVTVSLWRDSMQDSEEGVWGDDPRDSEQLTRGSFVAGRDSAMTRHSTLGNRWSSHQIVNPAISQSFKQTASLRHGPEGGRHSKRRANRLTANDEGAAQSQVGIQSQIKSKNLLTSRKSPNRPTRNDEDESRNLLPKKSIVPRQTETSLIEQAEKSLEEATGAKNKGKAKKDRATWFEEFNKQKLSGSVRSQMWEDDETQGDGERPESIEQESDSPGIAHDTTGILMGLAMRLGLGGEKALMNENILQKLQPKNCKQQRMQRVRQERKKKNRSGRRNAARRTELSLPAEEVRVLKEAFQRYDEDSSGDLDLREVNEAFQDLGLKPKTQDEKIELAKILEELAGEANGGLIFPEFCQVVQMIRQKIQDSQTAVLFSVFQRFDEDGSGFLDKAEVLQILGEIQVAPNNVEEEAAVFQVMDDITEGSDHPGEVGFSEFQTLIIKVRETIQGMRRAKEREIRDLHNLDPETFAHFRPELISVYTAFCHYDADGSGKLDVDEIRGLLAQFGLLPRCKHEQDEMDKLLLGNANPDEDAEPEFDFPQYLQLISRLRAKVAAEKRDELQEMFMQYDKDGSGDLSMGEISQILVDLGLQPRTRAEQEEIQLMMEEVDEDGSESCDFEEFCVLFQRISEKLQAMKREAERRKALELNFTLTDLQELRQSFETLDREGNGVLEISEIRRALQLMRKKIPSDTLRDLFDEVCADGSGVLEFQEFLQLMRMIEDSTELETMNMDSSQGRQSNNLATFTAAVKKEGPPVNINIETGRNASSTKALEQLKKGSISKSGSSNAKRAPQVFVGS